MPAAAEKWPRNIFALRSLARRLKGKRLKRPAPDEGMPLGDLAEAQHDITLDRYIGMLTQKGIREQPRGPKLGMTRKTYRGVVTWPTTVNQLGQRYAEAPSPAFFWVNDCD